jgi:hypothetical protein
MAMHRLASWSTPPIVPGLGLFLFIAGEHQSWTACLDASTEGKPQL